MFKFSPDSGLCTGLIASCCTALPGAGPCGTIEVKGNATNSNSLEEAYFNGVELISGTGPFACYLLYVHLLNTGSPGNFGLRQSRAQINLYTRTSGRNVATFFDLYLSAAELNDTLFAPNYWAVACLMRNNSNPSGQPFIIPLFNGNTSKLLTTLPNPTLLCL